MYDIVIVGAGPAGLSAAVTARARDKDVCVVSNKPQDSPLAKSPHVDNYPGIPAVSGVALLEKMVAHAHDLGATFRFGRVISVLPFGEHFLVTTGNESIEARAVILAPGTTSASAAFLGEQEYLGRGVSYCATCDGMLYRDATVCVVGLSPEAPEEASFLKELGATVHYLTPRLSRDLLDGIGAGIATHEGKVLAIEGDALGVTGVRFAEKLDATLTEENVIACQCVFVLRPQIAPTALLATLDTADGYIAADAQMRTSVTGVFAAGDCVGAPLQVAKAVGEGQLAAFAAVEFLGTKD